MHLGQRQKLINDDEIPHLAVPPLEVFDTVGKPLPTSSEDPALPLTDVQWVLGHARLTTTQLYLTPRREDVIRRMLAHHGGQAGQAAARQAPVPAPGYQPGTMEILFGAGTS